MNRRNFIRHGSLWVGGALIVEPVIKRLWAFPTNPAARPGRPEWRRVTGDTRGIHVIKWEYRCEFVLGSGWEVVETSRL